MNEQTPPTLTAPDWSAGIHDLFCPMCKYDLFGLSQPCCPECGYTFDWNELRDAKLTKHPYLFEHHPEANFKSYFQTMLHQLFQFKFWSQLKPTHQVNIRRLIVYWGVICILFVLLNVLNAANVSEHQWGNLAAKHNHAVARFKASHTLWPQADVQTYITENLPSPTWSEIARPGVDAFVRCNFPNQLMFDILLVLTAWPILTFLFIQIFKVSILRSGVQRGHFLRVFIYAGDHLIFVFIYFAYLIVDEAIKLALYRFGIFNVGLKGYSWSDWTSLKDLRLLSAIWLLIFLLRVSIARHRYLRVRQALTMIAISQIILVLSLACYISLSARGPTLLHILKF